MMEQTDLDALIALLKRFNIRYTLERSRPNGDWTNLKIAVDDKPFGVNGMRGDYVEFSFFKAEFSNMDITRQDCPT
jgi:hypothetical protein